MWSSRKFCHHLLFVALLILFVKSDWPRDVQRDVERGSRANLFGRCSLRATSSFPDFTSTSSEFLIHVLNSTTSTLTKDAKTNGAYNEQEHLHWMRSSLTQVNEKLAIGLFRGRPWAEKWLTKQDNSWQYPDDHPRKNKTLCLEYARAAQQQPIPIFQSFSPNTSQGFYTLTQQNVLVHESGIVAAACGYFQCLEGCETKFKFIGRRWFDSCSQQLHKQHIDWTVATSPSSPLLLERNDTAQPATSPLCREPSMEPWTYARRLFVISSLWDHNYHHLLVDVLPRLVYHLPFLRANPDILLHVRRSERYSKPAVAARSVVMKHRVFELLGLSPQRLVSGPVVASQVIIPRCVVCASPTQHAKEVHLLATEILSRSGTSPCTIPWISLDAHRGMQEVSPHRIVLQVRDCVDRTRCSWRLWLPDTVHQMVSTLRTEFPHSMLWIANDSLPRTSTADSLACELQAYRQADLLLGLHGAGMTNMAFLRPGSVVVEVAGEYEGRMMPYCGYYNALAAVCGVHHLVYYYDWRGSEPLPVEDIVHTARRFFEQVAGSGV